MTTTKIEPAELLVREKVEVLLAEAKMSASPDMWNDLGHAVTRALKRAILRAKSNDREVVRGHDI